MLVFAKYAATFVNNGECGTCPPVVCGTWDHPRSGTPSQRTCATENKSKISGKERKKNTHKRFDMITARFSLHTGPPLNKLYY